MLMSDDKKTVKVELDSILDMLLLEVAKQLLKQASKGDNLRASIDFLKLHKRSVTEDMVLGSSKDPNEYLDGLIQQLAPTGHSARDRR